MPIKYEKIGSNVAKWGEIQGNLNEQIDLNNELNNKENLSNKSTDINLGNSNILYPSQNAVKTYADTKINGSGNINKIAFFTSTKTLSSDTNLHWNNTNKRLGVGTSNPLATLHLVGSEASTFRLEDGSQASNKVLMCDNNGYAKWVHFVQVLSFENVPFNTGINNTAYVHIIVKGNYELSIDNEENIVIELIHNVSSYDIIKLSGRNNLTGDNIPFTLQHLFEGSGWGDDNFDVKITTGDGRLMNLKIVVVCYINVV